MKPKTILMILVLLLALFNSEKIHAQTLILWHPDGMTTEVDLFTQPRIQFANDKMLITSSVVDLEYDKSNIIRFTFKGNKTGINVPKVGSNFEQKDDQIIFHDVKSSDHVAVYYTNGIRVPVRLSFQGKDAILSLSTLPIGVYLVSVNGQTSKFTKK